MAGQVEDTDPAGCGGPFLSQGGGEGAVSVAGSFNLGKL